MYNSLQNGDKIYEKPVKFISKNEPLTYKLIPIQVRLQISGVDYHFVMCQLHNFTDITIATMEVQNNSLWGVDYKCTAHSYTAYSDKICLDQIIKPNDRIRHKLLAEDMIKILNTCK